MQSQTDSPNRFYIHTLGCKVNQYESQAMREILLKAGFKECLAKDIADIYIINTCTVTHSADRESRHLIGLCHRTNSKARIVVTGCYVENDADTVSFLPGVAHIIKNSEKSRVADILSDTRHGEPANRRTGELTITGFKGRTKAFLKIQDGCENRCSYCKVPLVRSVLKSKPLNKILEEAETLAANGFREIIIAGICLGAWGRDIFPTGMAENVGLKGASLADVLRGLNKIEGDFRIRLSSIEPKYITDELIGLIRDSKRICRHLHIPLQSGDDDILKRMNRPYTSAEYRSMIERIRAAMDGIAISTDVMVAFPGESDANFANTLSFLKSVAPARTHIFTYSRRAGTPAFAMEGEVGEEAGRKRYCRLKTAALMSSYAYRSRFADKTVEVLVETKRDKDSGLLTGYSDNYIKILFSGPDSLMGKITPVKVKDLNLTYTMGAYEPK